MSNNNEKNVDVIYKESDNYRKKRFISVEELAEILGVSKTFAYEVVKSSECEFNVVKLGRRLIIPTNSLFKWYDSLIN